MTRKLVLALATIIFLLPAFVSAQEKAFTTTPAKVNLWLQTLVDQNPGSTDPIHLFIKGNKEQIQQSMEALDGHYKYGFRDYCAIMVPLNRVHDLAKLECVSRIEFSMDTPALLNDTMLINNNVLPIHQGLGDLPAAYEGEDVIIGIIDTGIDFTHPDFQDSLGNTRILNIWDQTFTNGNAAWDPNRIPVPYGYGNEWDQSDIDAGLCAHIDPQSLNGHGTNVAGGAASNGNAVGKYEGVAPKADIIVVASNFGAFGWTQTVAEAVDYIFSKADAAGKPCVINGSLGTYYGSHDGTDAAAQMIDSLVTSTNGRVMVCAAGNCGHETMHMETAVTSDTSFTWFEYEPNIIGPGGGVWLEAWADIPDFNNVWYAIGADRIDTSAGAFEFRGRTTFHNISSNLGFIITEPLLSNDGNLLGTVEFGAAQIGDAYILQVKLEAPDSSQYKFRLETFGSGQFDVWSTSTFGTSDMTPEQDLPSVAQFPPIANYVIPDSAKTIVSSWACLDNIITVGNYSNRSGYMSYDSVWQVNPTPARYLAPTSSHGPTRDGRLKPDITASGQWTLTAGVLSILDILKNGNASQQGRVAPEGFHHRQSGTSMASPVVAGVAALYFEKCPYANYADIIDALISNATTDSLTGSMPNNDWGNGRVDAEATLLHSNFQTQLLTGGSNVICPGDSLALFLNSSYLQYDWSDGSSQSTNFVSEAGSYYVDVVNTKGCVGSSDTVMVLQAQGSGPDVQVAGATEFCEGDSVTLSVDPVYNGYTWPDGSEFPEMTVGNQGNFYVVVVDTFGCELPSDTISIVVHPAPEPEVDLDTDTLSTQPGFNSYQWQRNNANITGATSNQFIAFLDGNYTVVVTDSLGCAGESDPQLVILDTWTETIENDNTLTVWPVPAFHSFSIAWDQLVVSALQIQMVNSLGQTVYSKTHSGLAPQGSTNLNVAHLPAGVYFVYIRGHRINATRKIVLN